MKKRVLPLLLSLFLLAGFVLGANASSTLEAISAYLNYGVTIEYEGVPKTMTDANGVRVYPITYKGSTYVPVRAVSDIVGVPVDWDGATKTVKLGTPEGGIDLLDTYQAYALAHATQVQSSQGKTNTIGGVEVSHWLDFMHNSDIPKDAHFNLGGKYSSITFQAYATEEMILTVYGDDQEVLAQIPLAGAAVPKAHTVPLRNTTELYFHVERNSRQNNSNCHVYIFDAKLS